MVLRGVIKCTDRLGRCPDVWDDRRSFGRRSGPVVVTCCSAPSHQEIEVIL
jgi:hypothetical protein